MTDELFSTLEERIKFLENDYQQMSERLKIYSNAMRSLLSLVGTEKLCSGCSARVWMVKHLRTGKVGVYNPDGISHFATCAFADDFKKGITQ